MVPVPHDLYYKFSSIRDRQSASRSVPAVARESCTNASGDHRGGSPARVPTHLGRRRPGRLTDHRNWNVVAGATGGYRIYRATRLPATRSAKKRGRQASPRRDDVSHRFAATAGAPLLPLWRRSSRRIALCLARMSSCLSAPPACTTPGRSDRYSQPHARRTTRFISLARALPPARRTTSIARPRVPRLPCSRVASGVATTTDSTLELTAARQFVQVRPSMSPATASRRSRQCRARRPTRSGTWPPWQEQLSRPEVHYGGTVDESR